MNVRTMMVAALLVPSFGVMTAVAQVRQQNDSCRTAIGNDTTSSSTMARGNQGGGIRGNDTLQTQRGPADTATNRGNIAGGGGRDTLNVRRDTTNLASNCNPGSSSTPNTGTPGPVYPGGATTPGSTGAYPGGTGGSTGATGGIGTTRDTAGLNPQPTPGAGRPGTTTQGSPSVRP